jgi:hypothetical protein
MEYVRIKLIILLTQPLVQLVAFGMMALADVLAIQVSLGIKVNANPNVIILLTQPHVPQMVFGMTPIKNALVFQDTIGIRVEVIVLHYLAIMVG